MYWTILALSMTVMMGGFIAYNGDLWGRKLGKKRITLFGMRPRNTAILITSGFGILISLFTTGILFLVVPPVRDAMLYGEEAIRQKYVLTARNKRLQSDNEHLGKTNAALDLQNVELTRSHAQAVVDLKAARRAGDLARSTLRAAIAKRDAALADQRRLLADVSDLRARIDGQKRVLASLQGKNHELVRRNLDLSGQNAQLAKMNHDLAEKNIELAKLNADAARDNEQISRDNESMQRTNDELMKVKNALQTYNASLTNQNADLEKRNKELLETRNTLITVASRQGVDLNELGKRLEAMRTRRISVHGGEDLARRVVPAKAAPAVVRKVIGELIHDANQAALARGAAPSDSSARAVQVVDKRFEAISPAGNVHPVEVTEADRIDGLVDRLAGADRPICLLAIAVANSVEGEPAAIDFQPFVDRLIYTRGFVIADHKFDASAPVDKLYPELMGFLKDLGQQARERGVIPSIDPSTGDPQVGTLTWPELAELVERVRVTGRRIKLTARAADDTNASGPLHIDFRIDPTL